MGDILKIHNIPFLIDDGESIELIFETTLVMGKILGKEENAERLVKMKKEKLTLVREKLKENSLPGEVLNILGIENIAKGLVGNRPILSTEYLLQSNPDILIGAMSIKSPMDIVNDNPILTATNIGKGNNLLLIDSHKILRAIPRIIDELEELHRELEELDR